MIKKPKTDQQLVDASGINLTAPDSETPVAPVPRRRGRPRKNPLPEQAAPASTAPASEAHVAAVPPASASGEQPAPAPRVKRRKQQPAPDEQPAAPSQAKRRKAQPALEAPAANPALEAPKPLPTLDSPKPLPALDAPESYPALNAPPKRARQYNQSGGKSSNQNNNQGTNQNKNGYQQFSRRPRRSNQQGGNNNQPREQIVPQASREELALLKIAELRSKAAELELDISEIKKKDELVEAVFAALVKAEGFIACEGVLDLLPEGYGFLRTAGYLPGENDVYVGMSMVRRHGLRKGDLVIGQVRPARDSEKYAALHRIDLINALSVEESRNRRRFADLTPIYPDERLIMEHGQYSTTARTIDLVAPIGKGQRGLIVSPPKAGKTTILKDIAAAISANNPDVHLMCLLVDERPEEVTDMERSIKGEVVSSTFDMPSENHIAVAELVAERAKRLVENGRDVVILLDSITRLARAYNLAQPASGRILSGGVDSTALYPPKRFLGAARNIEGGGSLTILASALIETGSKMDEVIFEEFKGTGNMELRLDRDLADRRIFPAIDPVASGTRKEELLLDTQEAPLIWAVRRILANMNNTERAMEMLIKSLKQTQTNAEFLMRTAKKAQQRSSSEISEL
ncbi:MAG: transcription termination factor Rho [Coriobacteriales bacterium]|jgi:transcription termination factor Rho|nr:transcription termination factor Rho [Coriobacteriales bacterium]